MYKLPDSPEKKALIEYLTEQIEENDHIAWMHEGDLEEKYYVGKENAYRDILKKIL